MATGWNSERGGGGYPCSCLLQISLRQGLQADPGALAALCEKTDNDIRACINTLQVGGEEAGCGGVGQGAAASQPHTLCPVPARARPAGAECSGRADHTSRPQGPAQGALLCVAGGLPAAPGPEVDGVAEGGAGQAQPGYLWCPRPGPKPCVCSRSPLLPTETKATWALLSRLCLSLPHCRLLGTASSREGCLESGGCCHQE